VKTLTFEQWMCLLFAAALGVGGCIQIARGGSLASVEPVMLTMAGALFGLVHGDPDRGAGSAPPAK
jgi:hypothetical protein